MIDNQIQTYYFLGIGGIGMSALARYFAAKGARVLGYDRTPSPLTKELEAEGIAVQYDDSLDKVKELDTTSTIVVQHRLSSHRSAFKRCGGNQGKQARQGNARAPQAGKRFELHRQHRGQPCPVGRL